jgi:hypothetical protein
MANFNHLMLDIETMGTKSYSAIVSIGAVLFDIETGEIRDPYHQRICLTSSLNAGLTVDGDTVMWWLGQGDEARKSLIEFRAELKHALQGFKTFYDFSSLEAIWGNSPRFDCGLLQNAFDKVGLRTPWDFRKERCLRTLVSFAPHIKEQTDKPTNQHDALADCLYQVEYCHKTWKYLKHE